MQTDSSSCFTWPQRRPLQKQIEQVNLRVPMIIPPLELGNVSREHLRRNDVVGAVHAPLQLRPESFNGVRVRSIRLGVLSHAMFHGVMLHF